ncbi:hypothetical protein O181_022805 [Austropuccinia psidii MF-1]|uniref:Uncharacterized protein n=1 Tax=Austropuccinia psidii MF-1 TaxID=1389203 RepID=A0A9Q3CI50_9BASI|nr:hypothetical protein [Austropuccinia psidii MF-1]
MGPGHMGEEVVHGPPGILAYGSILALGDSNSPLRIWTTDPRTRKRHKRPKKAKKALNHNMVKNGHSDGQDAKHSRWSKMAKNPFLSQVQGQWGQDLFLDYAKDQSG